MPFDAVFLKSITDEISRECLGGKVDKISMPEKDRVLLGVRSLGQNKKLLLCANANHPRIQLTDMSYGNPDVPPMFCMLLRKHILAGKITEIKQLSFERAVKITFSVSNEFFEPESKSIVLEVLGRQSNILLLDGDDKIVSSLRQVSFNENASRQVLPGAKYRLPDSMNKMDPHLRFSEIEEVLRSECSAASPDKVLMSCVMGLSPLLAREIAFRAGVSDKHYCDLDNTERDRLARELGEFTEEEKQPYLLMSERQPKDFSVCEIKQYGGKIISVCKNSFSTLLDEYYTADDTREILKSKGAELSRLISGTIEKISKKLANQENELSESRDREKYRVYGELLTANISTIKKGSTECSLINYYDENMSEVTVPLDNKLSAAQNAQRYFKKYQKLKTAEEMLAAQIKRGRAELEYFKMLSGQLALAETSAEIDDIRNELTDGGYIRARAKDKRRQKPSQPYHFVSKNGFDIFVGRNNIQNDYLTHKFAAKNDLWFHALNLTGSHVIVVTRGKTVPDDDIVEAAEYAAYYSSGRGEDKVPVTYTPIKVVKKPSGGKPGFVIYSTSDTVYVSGNKKEQ